MADETIIAWTRHTQNFWMGCLKIAPGCANCYAETLTKNRMGISVWGPSSRRQMTGASIWSNPKKWNREATNEGKRRMVFCSSLCDVFEEFDGPITNAKQERLTINDHGNITPVGPTGTYVARWLTLNDLRRRVFEIIDATPWLDWQLLTKRPENIRKMWCSCPCDGDYCTNPTCDFKYRDNVWLGTSISEQKSADQNLPELLKCRDLAPVLFVSYEPALGPVRFFDFISGAWHGPAVIRSAGRTPSTPDFPPEGYDDSLPGIDWLICGGESGPGFRPMNLDWARSARDQCKAAGVPFFFKQSSAIRTEMGIELDGQIVREYPTVQHA